MHQIAPSGQSVRRSRTIVASRYAALGAVAGAVALFTVGPAASAAPGATCAGEYLPVPDNTVHSTVEAGSSDGRFLLGTVTGSEDGESRMFTILWERGSFEEVTGLSPWTTLVDVNRSGTVVGHSDLDPDDFVISEQAFTYRDGEYTELPSPGDGYTTRAAAVNDRGDVVGQALDSTTGESVPVVWPADEPGTVRILEAPESAIATDISRDGTVVGALGSGGILEEAFVWSPGGEGRRISDAPMSAVTAVSQDWAVGWEVSETSRYVLWNLATGEETVLPEGVLIAADVNRHGTVAGQFQDTSGARYAALVRADGTVVPLPGGGGANTVGENGTAAGFAPGGGALRWSGCR